MYEYFNDFITQFTGISENTITTPLSQIFVTFLAISVIYLLLNLVFRGNSVVKNCAFVLLLLTAFVAVMSANGITIISITKEFARMGVLSLC